MFYYVCNFCTYFFTSVTDTRLSALITTSEDDQALLERLAKREERRQRRMREALERQQEFDPTITDGEATVTITTTISEDRPSRRSRLRDAEEETTKNEVLSSETNSWTEKEEKILDQNVAESKVEVLETVPVKEEPAAEPASEEPKDTVEKKEEEEERPWRSYHREQVSSSKIHI